MTLQELFDHGVAFARKLFDEHHEITAMWIAETEDGFRMPIAAPFQNQDEKREVIVGIKKLFKDRGVVRYVYLSEAWVVDVPLSVSQEWLGGDAIAKHPERREGINVVAEDKEGHTISGMMYINRPENGDPVLEDLERFDGDIVNKTDGLLAGILEDDEPEEQEPVKKWIN